MTETPSECHEFDWVQVRSDCTVGKVFERLEEGVKGDLEKLCKCESYQAQRVRHVIHEKSKKFGIVRDTVGGVFFNRLDNTIKVTRVTPNGGKTTMMELSLVLNDKGECRLVDEADEVRSAWWLWQVRRRALEEIFFDSVRMRD